MLSLNPDVEIKGFKRKKKKEEKIAIKIYDEVRT